MGVAGASIVGGLLAAGAVYRLTARRGVLGDRLILIGIGVSVTLIALNEYLVTRADLDAALAARTWLYGA